MRSAVKNTMGPAVLAFIIAAAAAAGTVSAQSRSELQESMKQRYPRLQRLRERGVVGETYRGYVEAVTAGAAGDDDIQNLLRAENTDRRALYEIIAQDVGTTPEAVGRINAQRILEDAAADVYFKTRDGTWKKKKEMEKN